MGKGEGVFFDADVSVDVGVGGSDAGVAEPECDHGAVDAGLQPGRQELSSGAIVIGFGVDPLVAFGRGAPPWKPFRTASKIAEP